MNSDYLNDAGIGAAVGAGLGGISGGLGLLANEARILRSGLGFGPPGRPRAADLAKKISAQRPEALRKFLIKTGAGGAGGAGLGLLLSALLSGEEENA